MLCQLHSLSIAFIAAGIFFMCHDIAVPRPPSDPRALSMTDINTQSKLYKQALRSLDRNRVLQSNTPQPNTSKIIIQGLLVKLYTSEYCRSKTMLVKPEWIRLWYKVSDGAPFDLTLWEELSQPEKNFMFRCISTLKPGHERDIGERHRKEAKQLFDRLYIAEGSLRAGNNSRAVYQDLCDAIAALMERNLLSKNIGGRLIRQYGRVIGELDDAIQSMRNEKTDE